MRFLVTSDNHLGYKEDDPIVGMDSFVTFEEILRIAVARDVDFILQGGDLFHENVPSKDSLGKTFQLLNNYCIGNRPVNFESSMFLNVDSAHINISLPIIAIHGNHDDPCGRSFESILEVIEKTLLLNYVGKHSSIDFLEIEPVVIKSDSKVAIYGVGNVRDARMHSLFVNKKVHFKKLPENEDAVNVLMLHQNRIPYSGKDFVPLENIPDWFDLVIFGHEHEPMLYFHSSKGFTVLQSGSTVRTSLSLSEKGDKFCYIVDIHENIDIEKVRLNTVRPFVMKDIFISEQEKNPQEVAVQHIKELLEPFKQKEGDSKTQQASGYFEQDNHIGLFEQSKEGYFEQDKNIGFFEQDNHIGLFEQCKEGYFEQDKDSCNNFEQSKGSGYFEQDKDSCGISYTANSEKTKLTTEINQNLSSQIMNEKLRKNVEKITKNDDSYICSQLSKKSSNLLIPSSNNSTLIKPLIRLRVEHDGITISKNKVAALFKNEIANYFDILRLRLRKKKIHEQVCDQPVNSFKEIQFTDLIFRTPCLSALPESVFIERVKKCLETGNKNIFDEMIDETLAHIVKEYKNDAMVPSMMKQRILEIKTQVNKDNGYPKKVTENAKNGN